MVSPEPTGVAAYALWLLSTHPRVQEKLADEVRAHRLERGEVAGVREVAEYEYLLAVLKESEYQQSLPPYLQVADPLSYTALPRRPRSSTPRPGQRRDDGRRVPYPSWNRGRRTSLDGSSVGWHLGI